MTEQKLLNYLKHIRELDKIFEELTEDTSNTIWGLDGFKCLCHCSSALYRAKCELEDAMMYRYNEEHK